VVLGGANDESQDTDTTIHASSCRVTSHVSMEVPVRTAADRLDDGVVPRDVLEVVRPGGGEGRPADPSPTDVFGDQLVLDFSYETNVRNDLRRTA